MSGKDAQDNKPKGPSPVPLPSASHAPVSIAGISLSSTLPTSISSTHMSPHTTTHPTDASSTMTTTRRKSSTISQVAVDALGDLLESASVLSAPDTQEQRRKLNYKSTALIAKTLKQSQEERRRQALAEQAKKRYQFTNHARRLALFSSGQHTDEGSETEEDDDDGEEDEDGSEEDEDDEDDEAKDEGVKSKKSKKAKLLKQEKDASSRPHLTGEEDTTTPVPVKHKRRLSSGSESEAGEGGQKGAKRRDADTLSPKKPRLQKTSPKTGKKKKKDRNLFSDQLMMPEVMTEIPIDLDTSYYIVPLPIGHRCFVISADGKTIARLPSGQLLVAPFESCLPAGSATYRGNRRADYCILDCVYSSVTRTFWTLDIMCWRGHPVYECETEFRFWWLRGKLAEIETLQAKWIATQTKDWEASQLKKRNRRAKQAKRRQEKAAAAAMDVAPTDVPETNGSKAALPSSRKQHDGNQDGDDGDDEADLEGMDVEDFDSTSASISSSKGHPGEPNKFWPVAFTPLPYFNASTDLVRLLAESMYHPNSALSTTTPWSGQGSEPSIPLTMAPKPIPPESTPDPTSFLGTMALSGEIATAASLFPAHDNAQKARQDKTLSYERAGGLVFFNKKTMYVLGTTPLCGWVAIEHIGDVFFGEEGGVGPVPGTSAVEGREVEMEDALERIRI